MPTSVGVSNDVLGAGSGGQVEETGLGAGREAGAGGRRISVLVVDDHRMFAESLALLIETEPDIEVVGLAATGEEGVEMASSLSPHVVLLDLELPGIDGVEATRRIAAETPSSRVVLISAAPDDDAVADAILAGASGLVPKVAAPERLIPAIRAAVEGRIVLPEDRHDAIAGRLADRDRPGDQTLGS